MSLKSMQKLKKIAPEMASGGSGSCLGPSWAMDVISTSFSDTNREPGRRPERANNQHKLILEWLFDVLGALFKAILLRTVFVSFFPQHMFCGSP